MSIRKRINKIISCILTMAMVLSCMANMTPAFAAASIEKNDVPTVYSGSGNETASGSAIAVYYDFGAKGAAASYVQVAANATVDGCTAVTDGKDITSAITDTSNPLYDGFRTNAPGAAKITFDVTPGEYDVEMGIATSIYAVGATYAFTSGGETLVTEDITVDKNADTVKTYENLVVTDGQLVLDITATGSKFGVINYIAITPVIKPVTYTFDEGDLDIKGDAFKTSDCTDKAIGTTGCKLSVSGSGNYTNAIIRNNESANEGYWPYTQPVDNGYYLFLGAGNANDNAYMTITLPEAVPAGRAIDIEFVKISGSNKAGNDRGAANSAQSIVVDTTTIDVQTGYVFTSWNTKTVVTENDMSSITVKLGKWAAIGIKSITVREAVPEDFAKVNVEFDLNGHGTTTPDSQELSVGSSALEPTAPRADGYVFRGWYKEAECTNAWNFATGVTEDTTLYARWIEDPVVTVEDALYTQFFSGSTAASSYLVKKAASIIDTSSILADDTHGYYLYAKATGGGDRDAFVEFSGLDVSEEYTYTIEFDAMLAPSYNGGNLSQWFITSSDATYSSDITSGYILKLKNSAAGGTEYTVNDDANTTITIPSDKWCHFKLDVDKVAGTVTINITGDGVAVTDVVANYNGNGNAVGFYSYAGRYWHSFSMDNVVVYETPVEYATVTFNVQGKGTATAPEAQEVVVGETATEPTAPTEESWVFGGWFTDAECTEAYEFTTPVTGTLELFAKWTEATGQKYTVTFDVQDKGTAPEAQEIEEGKTATKPETDPSYDGWEFGGWYKDAECTTEYNFATPVTENTTVYAKWTQIFTVTFDVQGKGDAPEAQKVLNGEKATTPGAPTYDGYAFEGWYTDAACTEEYSFDTAVTKDTTLYAKVDTDIYSDI